MDLVIDSANCEQPEVMSFGSNELTVAISSLSIGGAERIVLDWAMRIYPRWKVHLIVLRNRTKEWPVPAYVKVTRLENPERMGPLKKLPDINARRAHQLRLLGKEIADSDNPVCVCHLLTKQERDALTEGGAHVVAVLHNAKEGWIENAQSLFGSVQTIAVSEACSRDLKESGWTGPISVIRHIPARRELAPNAREYYRQSWNVPLDATVIGMIGAVKPQKNYSFALRVMKAFLEKRDAYLVILGGPVNTKNGHPEWKEVVNEVHRLGLRSRVAMPGFIPNATACLPAFDVMLNTSHYEGLSIATLEELAHGLPVVASKVGGQGEISCEGLKLIAEKAPEDEWASALERSLESKFDAPSWLDFPAFRLWTLAGLAYPVKSSGKTLFVTANLNSGGAQRSLVNLAKALKGRMSFSVAVTGNTTTPYFHEDLKNSGVEVTRAGKFWNAFMYAENIVRKICAEQIGTVCFWNVDARIKLLIAKALGFTQVRFIDVSPGDYLYGEMDAVAEFQQLIAFGKKDYFQRVDKLVLKHHGTYPAECEGKVTVIPNGVSTPRKVKTDYAIRGAPRVVVNGRIAETKFILEIIAAMKIVREKFPGAELHFFGAAEPLHREYAEKVLVAAEAEIGKRIFFHGVDFEVREKLAEFDVYVVLGKHQGCPNALLEALSAGLPAIANDDGGTREQIIHGESGWLIKSTSPEELSKALLKIFSDRQLAERLGRAGKKHVAKTFSMEKMAASYLALLKEKSRAGKSALLWRHVSAALNSLISKISIKGGEIAVGETRRAAINQASKA